MFGILLITHGNLGDSLIDVASFILGERPTQIESIGLSGSDYPELKAELTLELLNKLNTGQGVLLLTDIFGASPSNLLCRYLSPDLYEGVSGVNLPMLLRVLSNRRLPISEVLDIAMEGGKNGIMDLHNMCSTS